MKVLHLSTWKEACGIADYSADLIGALDAQGVRSEVYPLTRRGKKYMSRSAIVKDLSQFTKKARSFDLVHIQHEFSFFADNTGSLPRSIHLFGFVLKRLAKYGLPTVVTFHTEPFFTSPLWDLFRRPDFAKCLALTYLWRRNVSCFFKRSNVRFRAIVHTRKARLNVKKSGFSFQNIEVMPVGVAPRSKICLNSNGTSAKEKLGYPPDVVLLSLFGFISGYKGPHVAVRALKELPPQYHLALVGGSHPESPDRTVNDILRALSEDQALRARVRVTGYLKPETIDLYHAATDICLAPYADPRISGSAAINWALSSGKPVIASKVPTFVDINDTADCLLLFTNGAFYELAWQIQRLAGDQELQLNLTRNAQKYVAANCWPEVAQKTLHLYANMLGYKVTNPTEERSSADPLHSLRQAA
jgi:glycosyltransferase involved in cell wall biosynthesis